MRKEPSAAELAQLGLAPEDVADDFLIELWPDTEPAIFLFIDLRTQWRMGPAGPVGLDYACLPAVMRMKGIKRADQSALFDDLRVMEDEALRTIAEESK